MYLIKNHVPACKIYTPKSENEAAGCELAAYMERLTGKKPELLTSADMPGVDDALIVLDTPPFASIADALPETENLGREGYLIAQRGGNLFLLGAAEESVFYALYDILESYAGIVFMTSKDEYIPEKETVEIPDNLFDLQKPAMEYRETYYRDLWDTTFARKMRLNGQACSVGPDGRVREHHRGWGFWCHSFFALIPPAQYFDAHPEYFSLVDGERVKDGQLCCTDDNMIDEAIRNLRIFMEKEPDARYWSISQNDTTRNCQCPRCKALDDKAGSPIGSIMYFVNRVAEAFPDKVISTLSYWYSRTAPKELFMRDNVHIMFCNIECNRSKPIQYDPASESFMQDMAVWHKYCKNIFLWDYNIQFKNLIAPFPNLRVLAPNMRCFYEGGVRSVFNQANRENRGEFWALRGYLLAKLSWNPYCDTEALTNRFLAAYYGAAAPYIRAYIDMLHDALEASGEGLSIFGEPQDEQFLAPEKLDCYESILDCAKAAVAGDEILSLRVDEVRLGVVYARLKRRAWKDGDDRAALITFFADTAGKIGLEKVEEWKITTEMFIEDLDTPNA